MQCIFHILKSVICSYYNNLIYFVFFFLILQIVDFRSLKKSSSCSTIYLDDSTVSQPNLKNTVKCVALAIYYHIKNRTSERQIEIFDEKLHPLTVSMSVVNL